VCTDLFVSLLIPSLYIQNKDVTEAIQKVAAVYDCKIVEGVLSHQLKQFVIDGNKVVLSVSNADTKVDDAEFEENEVYAIDIVTSTGEGKVRNSVFLHVMLFFPCLTTFSLNIHASPSYWMRSRPPSTKGL
jgi:hypothetical protein